MFTKKRLIPIITILVVVVVILAITLSSNSPKKNAGSGGGTGNGKPTGTISFAEAPGASPNYIFPYMGCSFFSVSNTEQFQEEMYRPLYWFGLAASSTYVPNLSLGDKPKFSNGDKTITIHLREGVRFSPPVNREVTSEDVAYAFERGANPDDKTGPGTALADKADTPDKGPDNFIRACVLALPSLPGWRAEIIGADGMSASGRETDYVRRIKVLAAAAGVRMVGYLDHPLVLEAMTSWVSGAAVRNNMSPSTVVVQSSLAVLPAMAPPSGAAESRAPAANTSPRRHASASATTAPGFPVACKAFHAAFCALESMVSWTVAPLRVLFVIMSITLRTASLEESPVR